MNRKSFLKRLAFGLGAIAIAPEILANKANTVIPFPPQTVLPLKDVAGNSKPIKIKLKNTSSESFLDVELFNANQNIYKKNFGLPEGVYLHCDNKMDSPYGNTTYLKLLHEIYNQPLNIPLIYFKSNPGKVSHSSLDLKEKKYPSLHNPSEPPLTKYFYGYWTPYQLRSDEVLIKLYNKNKIELDYRTAIVIPKLEANAEVELHFYTQEMVDKFPVSNMFGQNFDEQFLEIPKPPYF